MTREQALDEAVRRAVGNWIPGRKRALVPVENQIAMANANAIRAEFERIMAAERMT